MEQASFSNNRKRRFAQYFIRREENADGARRCGNPAGRQDDQIGSVMQIGLHFILARQPDVFWRP
jgi:hypothetical protein